MKFKLLTLVSSRFEPDNWRVLRGMITVAFFVLLGKLAGASKEIGIAWSYGVSALVDIYVFAFVLINWAPSVLASSLNAVYVPLARRQPQSERHAFSAELSGALIIVGFILTLLILTFVAPMFVRMAIGFDVSKQAELLVVVRLLSPGVLLLFLASYLSARLLAEERHVNTLLESVPALSILLAVIIYQRGESVVPLVVGTLIGQCLQLVLLALVVFRAQMPLTVSFGFSHSQWLEFLRAFGLLVVGTIVMSLVPIIDQFLASRLPDGSISTLSYATRVLALGLGLGATAVGRAILPVLSDRVASGRDPIDLARKWSLVLLMIGIIGALIGWIISPIVVSILFERGAFTSEDTVRVSRVIRYGVTQIPFYFSSIVLVQLFASLRLYRVIVISSVLAVVVKLSIGAYLADQLGDAGIALSTGIMYGVNSSYFFWQTRRRARQG